MSGLGMRGKDLRTFMQVARQFNVILLIRQTNEYSLQYVDRSGFYPKPAAVKAKTADTDVGTAHPSAKGVVLRKNHTVGGLVIHPGLHPSAFKGAKAAKALSCWDDTMRTFAPKLVGKKVDVRQPETYAVFGVERRAESARWTWKVDTNTNSPFFGALQIGSADVPMSYVHGDYDLKDVIVVGQEKHNGRHEGKIDSVKNYTPNLLGVSFEQIQNTLNREIGTPMVQHGAEAQFAWHGDEGITIAYPDWRHETLGNAEAVQRWYADLGRKVLAQTGKDYLGDRTRMFHYGPGGMLKPGVVPVGVKY